MELQKVYEIEDYGMGYGHKRVGLRIDDRVVWFGFLDSSREEQMREFAKMESLIDEIVKKVASSEIDQTDVK